MRLVFELRLIFGIYFFSVLGGVQNSCEIHVDNGVPIAFVYFIQVLHSTATNIRRHVVKIENHMKHSVKYNTSPLALLTVLTQHHTASTVLFRLFLFLFSFFSVFFFSSSIFGMFHDK